MKHLYFLLIFAVVTIGFATDAAAQLQLNKPFQMTGGTNAERQITGVGNATAGDHAVNAASVQTSSLMYAGATGSGGNYAVVLNPVPAAYTAGMIVNFVANHTNTGVCSLQVNLLSAIPIKKGVTSNLVAGDIVSGQAVSVMYDGVNFQLLSSAGTLTPGSNNYIQNNAVNSSFGSGQAASLDIQNSGEIGGSLTIGSNLGIGTVSPGSRLDVAANAAGGQSLVRLIAGGNGSGDLPSLHWMSQSGVNKLEMWTDAQNGNSRVKSAGNLSLHAGNVGFSATNEFVSITTSGSVGIGFITPASKLAILQNSDGTSGGLRTYNTAQTQWTAVYTGGDNGSYFQNQSGYMMINSSGNVGVNTTTPGARFEVNGSVKLFGARLPMGIGTIYGPAPTDGFVVVIGRLDGTAGLVAFDVYAGTSSPPTNLINRAYSYNNGATYLGNSHSCVPVRKGEYYQIQLNCLAAGCVQGSAFAGDFSAYFIGMGQ